MDGLGSKRALGRCVGAEDSSTARTIPSRRSLAAGKYSKRGFNCVVVSTWRAPKQLPAANGVIGSLQHGVECAAVALKFSVRTEICPEPWGNLSSEICGCACSVPATRKARRATGPQRSRAVSVLPNEKAVAKPLPLFGWSWAPFSTMDPCTL